MAGNILKNLPKPADFFNKSKNLLKKAPLPAVLTVTQNGLRYYDGQTDVKHKFTPELIADLEIVDEAKFNQEIAAFINKNQFINRRVIIVLTSDIYYEKKFESKLGNEVEIDKFVQMIPFISKVSHEYSQETGSAIIVANKPFINNLVNTIKNHKLTVISVIPKSIYDQFITDLKQLNKNSLIMTNNPKRFVPQIKLKIPVNRTSILIGIFGTMLLILIIMVVSSRPQPERNNSLLKMIVIPTKTAVSPTPSVITITSAKIGITINNNRLTTKATLLRDRLGQIGFTNVTSTQTPTNTNSNRIIVSFNPRVSQDIKDKINAEVRRIFQNIIIKDSNDLSVDIQILIGQ
ncbi:MAG: hypothetical protein NTY75_01460 [Candidatus Shapirobacteria bacterium]|nr:hypothetical protein [Candidatus Shapirobacteria bacterium]